MTYIRTANVAERRIVGVFLRRPYHKIWGESEEEILSRLKKYVHNDDQALGQTEKEVSRALEKSLKNLCNSGDIIRVVKGRRITYAIPKPSTQRRVRREKRIGKTPKCLMY